MGGRAGFFRPETAERVPQKEAVGGGWFEVKRKKGRSTVLGHVFGVSALCFCSCLVGGCKSKVLLTCQGWARPRVHVFRYFDKC